MVRNWNASICLTDRPQTDWLIVLRLSFERVHTTWKFAGTTPARVASWRCMPFVCSLSQEERRSMEFRLGWPDACWRSAEWIPRPTQAWFLRYALKAGVLISA